MAARAILKMSVVVSLLPSTFACDRRHESGQIGSVNGRMLSDLDLQADLALNLPSTTRIDPRARAVLVSRLVDRTLLAEEARALSLDRDALVEAKVAGAADAVLAGELINSWRTTVSGPSQSEIDHFVDQNPQMFGERTIFLADEVRTRIDAIDTRALEGLRSIDSVIELLEQRGTPFQRGSATLDTLSMTTAAAKRLVALPRGEPFTFRRGPTLIIRSIVRTSPAPILGDRSTSVAAATLRQSAFVALVQRRMDALRRSASITLIASAPNDP